MREIELEFQIDSFYEIDLKAMTVSIQSYFQFTLIAHERLYWMEDRLAFNKSIGTSDYHKRNYIVFTADSNLRRLWRPSLFYTNTTELKASNEKLMLYPDGKVEYERRLQITFECWFNFRELPNDAYSCATVVYIHGMPLEITDFKFLEDPTKGRPQF